MQKFNIILWMGLILLFGACQTEDEQPMEEQIMHDETPYELNYGHFPEPDLPHLIMH